ncbi:GL13377 [Drosophila persimilis]|uniref:GL13377 n=1 Tax=Drosophila persimilis TaxID=7234 RepID=B4H347_DROPE|nr:GL13377 [Drosophila persimilis]
MIRALLSLWSPSAVSVSTEDEAQNQNLAQAQSARQIRARWGMRRQSQSGNVYPRFRHFSRHARMIAFEMAGRQNLANLLDRVEPNFHQPQAEQDPDFVAQFLVKNLTIDVFNAENQPGYGPSSVRPPPPPPPPAVN